MALRPVAVFIPGLLLVGLLSIVYWQIDAIRPAENNILQRRNFYGIVKVYDNNRDNPKRHYLQFKSGGVSHGKQWVSDDPARRLQPTTYYSPQTGAGRAIRFFQHKPEMRVGVVGLGVGTLAAYATEPSQSFKFYEINPEVVNIAAGSESEQPYFSFFSECKGKHEIVLGDARLSLESELEHKEPQKFDVLVLDAFSGDAVPAHLLTREAFAVYRQHLNPDGIIAVNIKNRYIYLAPVVKAAADYYHFQTTRIWTDEDPEHLLYEVDFMLVTNNKEFLAANPPILKPIDPNKPEQPEPGPVAWTDHFSNLYQLLMPE